MNRAESVEELKQTFAILDDDIEEIRSLAQGKMTGFYVGATIRAYSALVDGLLFQMRQVVISSEPSELSIFLPEEKMMLREKSYPLEIE